MLEYKTLRRTKNMSLHCKYGDETKRTYIICRRDEWTEGVLSCWTCLCFSSFIAVKVLRFYWCLFYSIHYDYRHMVIVQIGWRSYSAQSSNGQPIATFLCGELAKPGWNNFKSVMSFFIFLGSKACSFAYQKRTPHRLSKRDVQCQISLFYMCTQPRLDSPLWL